MVLEMIRARVLVERDRDSGDLVQVVQTVPGGKMGSFVFLTVVTFVLVLTMWIRFEVCAAERTVTKIGVSVAAITYAPVFLADAAGFFNEEGLRVEITNISGPAGQVALLSGELAALASDSFRLYRLAEQGDTRIIMVQKIIDALPLDVVVTKNWMQKTGVTASSALEARYFLEACSVH